MKIRLRWIQTARQANGRNLDGFSLFAILLLGLFSLTMFSAMAGHGQSESALQQSFIWFDGHVERTMWLNPDLLAEFNPVPEELSPVKLTLGTNALLLPESTSHVRFWQISGITQESALATISGKYPASRLSPVFHMSRSGSYPKFALPGNIKVVFKATWQSSQINQWLQTNGLELLEKIETIPPMYVIKTDSGLAALETANTIYRSGEVEMAMPNWWYKRVLR
jgi:hypothetical protein